MKTIDQNEKKKKQTIFHFMQSIDLECFYRSEKTHQKRTVNWLEENKRFSMTVSKQNQDNTGQGGEGIELACVITVIKRKEKHTS